jgi:hypothetical protein
MVRLIGSSVSVLSSVKCFCACRLFIVQQNPSGGDSHAAASTV